MFKINFERNNDMPCNSVMTAANNCFWCFLKKPKASAEIASILGFGELMDDGGKGI